MAEAERDQAAAPDQPPKRVRDVIAKWLEDYGEDPPWLTWAAEALENALAEVRGYEDAIPNVSLAMALLQAEAGEMDVDEVESLLHAYRPAECTCPPDLRARGGFTSTCPAHGTTATAGEGRSDG